MQGSNQSSSGGGGRRRKWENISCVVLTHIFSFLCMADTIFNVSLVCKSWHAATTDPILWKTLDLEIYFHKVEQRTRIYNRSMNKFQYPCKFRLFLDSVIKYNDRDINKLLLPVGKVWGDVELILMALRTPNLKFLYMPDCPMITEVGLANALELWSNLESISISFLFYKRYLLFQFIGENCKNVSSFKFNHEVFDNEIAVAMTSYLSGLKIVTLLCHETEHEALEILLDGLKNVEELYISEMVDFDGSKSSRINYCVPAVLSKNIVKKVSRLEHFHFRRYGHCLKCPTTPGNNKVIKE